MIITDKINGFGPVWKMKIKRKLDTRCEEILANAGEAENRFVRNFYSQIANCGKADVYEFACAVNGRGAIFEGAKTTLAEDERITGLYTWFALNNVLRFCREAGQDVGLREAAFAEAGNMLNLNEADRHELLRFVELQKRGDATFELEFTGYILKKIIGMNEWGRRTHAFVSGFAYEAFDGFMRSFTHYSPMKSLLYRADKIRK